MTTKLYLILFIFTISMNSRMAYSQSLKYENMGFAEALEKANKTDQLVFIQLESECDQCNSVADQGLAGSEIIKLFEKFICIKAGYNSEDYKKIISDFRIYPNYPSSLFIDKEGNYLASCRNKSTSNRNEYISLAATALSNIKDPPFKNFEKDLQNEKPDTELLRKYIIELNKQNFNIADLTARYSGTLTLKELQDTSELKFLIRTAPVVNSFLYKLLHSNDDLYKKAFESFSKEERIIINHKIIAKSKDFMMREKDDRYMHVLTEYVRSTYGPDHKAGLNAGGNLQLDYYKETKNPLGYYSIARLYYEVNFRRSNLDSIFTSEKNHTFQRPDGAIVKGGVFYQTGNQLNKMAFALYELSSDKEYLAFALKLSEQTLRYNYPAYMDTYARLLYKFGAKKDGIYWQQKAVDLCDSLHQPNIQLKEVLDKMINNTL